MLHSKRAGALAALMLAALLFISLPISAEGVIGTDLSGFSSVTFSGEPIDGSVFSSSELTVINIWQRWCGPCWSEMPAFQQLHEHYSETPGADVFVLGALYYGSDPSQVPQAIEFCLEHGYTWEQMVMCPELLFVASDGEPENEYFHIPQTLIVDRYGCLRERIVGSIADHDELFALVSGWLDTLRGEYAAEAGDVDSNGAVDVVDALLAMRHAMGIIALEPGQRLRGDMDGDGAVTVSDAIIIMRVTMGVR